MFANTLNLCQRGYTRLWMLRNLKRHGASTADLVDVYMKPVRCVLELAVSVWNPGWGKMDCNQIDCVQKTAFAIILGRKYTSYEQALTSLRMETIEDRRTSFHLLNNLCSMILNPHPFWILFHIEQRDSKLLLFHTWLASWTMPYEWGEHNVKLKICNQVLVLDYSDWCRLLDGLTYVYWPILLLISLEKSKRIRKISIFVHVDV